MRFSTCGCLVFCLALTSLSPRPARCSWPADPATNVGVCTQTGNQSSPAIASDYASGTIIAWTDSRASSSDIYAQRVLAIGAVDPGWPVNGRALCTATGNQSAASIVADGSGGAIVTWQDLRGGSTSDIYVQHVLASGAVDPAWPVNGLAVCTATGSQSAPACVSDNAGGAIVLWQDQRFGTTDDVFALHVLASGAVDPAWPADGAALCTAAGIQQRIRAIPDGVGGAIAVWYDQRGGVGNDDIYAQRVRASGVLDPAWPADGQVLCSATGAQQFPSIGADGSTGAIVTWYDERAAVGIGDVYAQHISSGGVVDAGWPGDGAAVCTATSRQQFPVLIGDGTHGAVISWQDSRSGANDIYAQRVLANGVMDPAWPADGRALCTAVNSQSSPVIDTDGAGGALVGWTDFRFNASVSDIFAQHVLAGGGVDPAWPADGRAISTATNIQASPRLLADGSGGAIVAWSDTRGGATNNDIYAQRVQANGQLGGDVVDVPSGKASGLALEPVRPNPAHGGSLVVGFTLPEAGPSTLELYDISGRRIVERDLSAFGPGHHTVELSAATPLSAGVYLMRLRHGWELRTSRVAVLH